MPGERGAAWHQSTISMKAPKPLMRESSTSAFFKEIEASRRASKPPDTKLMFKNPDCG
jgi:hypothetical protein